MFSKLSLSISAALLVAAFGGVVRAASVPAGTDIAAGESGNPDSTEYSKRMFSRHSPSNDEINAAETGNPDSVDNREQSLASTSRTEVSSWQSLEVGSSDSR
jgi:hypothetical protein